MPNSPIGGISFLINGTILLLGRVVNKFYGDKSMKCLISQHHVTHFVSTPVGKFGASAITYIIAIAFFGVMTYLSIRTLMMLFEDRNKVTIVAIVAESASAVLYAYEKSQPADDNQQSLHSAVAALGKYPFMFEVTHSVDTTAKSSPVLFLSNGESTDHQDEYFLNANEEAHENEQSAESVELVPHGVKDERRFEFVGSSLYFAVFSGEILSAVINENTTSLARLQLLSK